jgi:DNA invertase Pin-like site-specific DNA recombinase
MTANRVKQARAMYDAGGHTVQEIADTFGVTRPTIYRHLRDAETRTAL